MAGKEMVFGRGIQSTVFMGNSIVTLKAVKRKAGGPSRYKLT